MVGLRFTAQSRRSVAGVIEILSTATVVNMVDLLADALAPGIPEESASLLRRREPDEEAGDGREDVAGR